MANTTHDVAAVHLPSVWIHGGQRRTASPNRSPFSPYAELPSQRIIKTLFLPQKSHYKSDIGSIFSIISCHIK
jgi:hypothetical protein